MKNLKMKKLVLKKETVVNLNDNEMGLVNAGGSTVMIDSYYIFCPTTSD